MSQPTLVFIYGPPAAGKLTVARALAARTGFKVFHNHAAFDLAESVLPCFGDDHAELTERIRLDVIDIAARAGVGVIFTLVYGHPDDVPFTEQVDQLLANHGGRVCYVQLLPHVDELAQRVTAASRGEFGKLRDVSGLHTTLSKWDLQTPAHSSDLRIDNTAIDPDDAAATIQEHYALPRAP